MSGFDSGEHRGRGLNALAVGADVLLRGAVAVDVGVAHRRDGAELHGDSHADVLHDGEEAGAVLRSAADLAALRHDGVAAALGRGGTGLRKGRDRYGHADGGGLVAHGGAGLGLVEKIGVEFINHLMVSFPAVANPSICAA